MKFSTQDNAKQVLKRLSDILKRQVPYATRIAINNTLKEAKPIQEKEIVSSFHQPVRRTRSAIFTLYAKPSRLVGELRVKDRAPGGTPPSKYLAPGVFGGERRRKGIEVYLQARGFLQPDEWVVPSRVARNAAGNLPAGIYKKIAGSNLRDESSQYFYARIRGTGGIWKRSGRGGRIIKPVLIFVRRPVYKKKYAFFDVAYRHAKRRYPPIFRRALRHALRTAR